MHSESLEEYLEAIYTFNERGKPARTKELAERLRVSPPSVTQMVKEMAEEGLVEYEPYRGGDAHREGDGPSPEGGEEASAP